MSYYEVWDEGTDDRLYYRVTWGAELVGDAMTKAAAARLILRHCHGRWQSVMTIDRTASAPSIDALLVDLGRTW